MACPAENATSGEPATTGVEKERANHLHMNGRSALSVISGSHE